MDKIIDIVFVAIFIMCVWSGYKKGLVMSVGGIIVIIISIYGANLLSNTFSYEVIPALRPFASGYLETKINEDVLVNMGFGESDYSVEDILEDDPGLVDEFCTESFKSLGIYQKTAEKMAGEAKALSEEQGIDIVNSMVEVLCKDISYAAGFTLAFLLILIILTVIGNIPNLSFKIPNLDRVNDIGGIAGGVITAFAFCSVLVWVLKFLGMFIGENAVSDTVFANLFAKIDLIGGILGI
jgi:hypothetical protein